MKRKREGSYEDGSLEGARKFAWSIGFLNPALYHSSYILYLYVMRDERYYAHSGIISTKDSVIIEGSEERISVVNMNESKLVGVDTVDLSKVKHDAIVDLSVEGDRWEGDVLNDKPCGWGVLYDGNNKKVYEGFRIGEVNVCYGCKYYSDTEMIEYVGEWCNGMRWGRGVQYDQNGSVVFDGEWLNDGHLERRVVITSECAVFHNRIEELVVNDGCCNKEEWKVLDLSFISNLKSLRVGSMCFCYVKEVKLIELNKLESVEIGNNCFEIKKRSGKDPDYSFCLKDCPKLKSLRIGHHSFPHYSVCEIENVDALEVIEIGKLYEYSGDFKCASLELKSILDL